MKITDALINAFAPYRNVYSPGNVVVKDVSAPINARNILIGMGLNVSEKIVVMEFEDGQSWMSSKFISSYQYLEAGTEDNYNQNNLATYIPALGTLIIHHYTDKETVGRDHWIGYAKKWLVV